MSGQFLGEITPLFGRWHWPYSRMKPGDWFTVDRVLRSTESVRQIAGVRAAQLGKRFSVRKNEVPGFTVVRCVPFKALSLEDVMD